MNALPFSTQERCGPADLAQVEASLREAVDTRRTIAIVGGGSIGVAFALVFARAGWPVRLYDPQAARRAVIESELMARLDALRAFELIEESSTLVVERVRVVESLDEALHQAFFVQECAPENIAIKQELFAQLDRLAPEDALLASVSSAIPASSFASELKGRERCLVTHPGNPPYLLPVIEIVPASFTSAHTAELASALYRLVGLQPVRVHRELEGFVFNRLQGALLREAYCLVRDGVVSVEDLDLVVREGLGLRWSVIGPFETVDLNTRGGIASHAQKMGPAYELMGAQRGQRDPWTPELVQQVDAQRRQILPLEDWEARVQWRDEQLMRLAQLRQSAAWQTSQTASVAPSSVSPAPSASSTQKTDSSSGVTP